MVSVAIVGTLVSTGATAVLFATGVTTPTEAEHDPGMGIETGVSVTSGSLVVSISIGRAYSVTVLEGFSIIGVIVVLPYISEEPGAPVSTLSITACKLVLQALVEVVAVVIEPSEHVSDP